MHAAFLAFHIEGARHLGACAGGHLPGDKHLVGQLGKGADLPVARQIAKQTHQHDEQAQDDQRQARAALKRGDQLPLPAGMMDG